MNKVCIIIAATLAMAACSNQSGTQTQQAEEQERTEVVSVTALQPRTIERTLDISTNLQGYETVNIAPSIQGRIEHIYVEVGDRKQKGDLLVRMDQTQYTTSKIAMGNLDIQMKRMDALIETGSVSQQTYDQTKLSYDQTKENLQFLEQNTFVKAPFSGVISAKNYEDGELYAGQPIVVLTQINKLKALISIPETYFPKVKQGQALTLTSTIYPDQVFPATIEVVYPTIDASSHTFQAKIVIPNGKELLRPGMYVTTTLGLGKAEVIVAPYQAVEKLVGANDRYVFINENGYAKRVSVTLGQRFDQDIELIAPELKEGVELVTKGQHKLVDGVKINIVKE